MSIYIKGIDKPLNCLECPFLSKFEEFSIRNIDEYPDAYEKIAHCMLCPKEIEDPWRNTVWLLKNTESWCPIEQKDWILVSERLPEERINPYTKDFDEVLCTTDWGEVLAFKFGTPIIHNKPHFWLGGAIMDEHIIAWQYKPEPYKEGDQ